MQIKIRPACDTFDSNEKPLLAGETYTIPEDLSEEDAKICVEQEKADEVELEAAPEAPQAEAAPEAPQAETAPEAP